MLKIKDIVGYILTLPDGVMWTLSACYYQTIISNSYSSCNKGTVPCQVIPFRGIRDDLEVVDGMAVSD